MKLPVRHESKYHVVIDAGGEAICHPLNAEVGDKITTALNAHNQLVECLQRAIFLHGDGKPDWAQVGQTTINSYGKI